MSAGKKEQLVKSIIGSHMVCAMKPLEPEIASVFINELAEYEIDEIERSLKDCMRTVRGNLYLADIVKRIESEREEKRVTETAVKYLEAYYSCTGEVCGAVSVVKRLVKKRMRDGYKDWMIVCAPFLAGSTTWSNAFDSGYSPILLLKDDKKFSDVFWLEELYSKAHKTVIKSQHENAAKRLGVYDRLKFIGSCFENRMLP